MRLLVLGSAAGGGFPQWNCGCPNCDAVRRGDPRVVARTQDSIAFAAGSGVGGAGDGWTLINASPDILQQIAQNRALHPRAARHSPIQSIILTNGDLDHILGLFSLRESWPLILYATDAVRRGLEEHNGIFRTLRRFPTQVTWRSLPLDEAVALADADGAPSAITVVARPVPGKPPVHLMGVREPSAEDNIAIELRDARSGAVAVYAGAASRLDEIAPRLDRADCVFVDGTFWSSDELVALGLSRARAEDMAHLPIGGDLGSLKMLASTAAKRKIFTHINNSNPILVSGSAENRAVLEAGWEIATDGMEIAL